MTPLGPESSRGEASTAASLPLLRIVRGDATDSEVAAVTLVLLASRGASVDEQRVTSGGWSDRSRGLRHALDHGRGAWGRSARTR